VNIIGITDTQFAVLCSKAFENLPTDTSITIDDVDAILTWVLPNYKEMVGIMSNDMDKDIVKNSGLEVEEVSKPMLNPDWEAERLQQEGRMHRQIALDFALKTEQISTIGAGDTSDTIRKRIIDNADEYVMYIMDGSVKD
jgi:hypothetical protein